MRNNDETILDVALIEGYRRLRLTVIETQRIRGFAYPHIMVNMRELAEQHDHNGEPKRALDMIKAALDTWKYIKSRHQVPML
jgi:molybdopterin-guanine dinucleotide biosynthesis protein